MPTPVMREERAVPMTPARGAEQLPPVRVTIVPGVGSGPCIEVTQVPVAPTVPALPSKGIEPTATPIPAN